MKPRRRFVNKKSIYLSCQYLHEAKAITSIIYMVIVSIIALLFCLFLIVFIEYNLLKNRFLMSSKIGSNSWWFRSLLTRTNRRCGRRNCQNVSSGSCVSTICVPSLSVTIKMWLDVARYKCSTTSKKLQIVSKCIHIDDTFMPMTFKYSVQPQRRLLNYSPKIDLIVAGVYKVSNWLCSIFLTEKNHICYLAAILRIYPH